MQLAHRTGEVQHDLGHVRAGLDVAAPFQLEDVALGPQDHAGGQPGLDAAGHDATPPRGACAAAGPLNRLGAKRRTS